MPHCLRQRVRWAAEDPSSAAPLRAFLGKAGLARLAAHFLSRRVPVRWEQMLALTPKTLGGHLFPHVDFKFSTPEAAAQFRWAPHNTSGRIYWGLPADERERLGKALRTELVRIAAREQSEEDRLRALAEIADCRRRLLPELAHRGWLTLLAAIAR